jgi:hypothetical protein
MSPQQLKLFLPKSANCSLQAPRPFGQIGGSNPEVERQAARAEEASNQR